MRDVLQFRSSASLEVLTGKRAYTLPELLDLIRTCTESSIFNHTFSALHKLREVRAPYNSDFAVWVLRSLGENALAEKIMAVDFREYSSVESLRQRLVHIIENYRTLKPAAFDKKADDPFFLHDVQRFIYLTDKFAYDLSSFRDLLSAISRDSLYYHFIESRLETKLETDDFSTWIEKSLGLAELAARIKRIDIHVHTLEDLRSRIIHMVDEHLNG
ncbi:MAG: hypothetical protein CVU57_25060 [Deltaproteobacteria bacterium HGW-Deltaproteobacteria-15]|nr:MAG: hypothetical protein CVU57_25060 [Deltaproteobacteria bacterium HGW-Deltaproteobacteria-15]